MAAAAVSFAIAVIVALVKELLRPTAACYCPAEFSAPWTRTGVPELQGWRERE